MGYLIVLVFGFGVFGEDCFYFVIEFMFGTSFCEMEFGFCDEVLVVVGLYVVVHPLEVCDWLVMVISFFNGGIVEYWFYL